MEQINKRGNVDLTAVAIGIIILGIVVTIGSVILTSMRNSRLTDLPTIKVLNETKTTVDDIGETLTNGWITSVDSVTNRSGGELINSANYTVTTDNTNFGTATIKFSGSALKYNNSDWNVSYTRYNVSQADWDLANKANIGIAEYGNWFKIIVIVAVAAAVLGLIFLAFGRGGMGESGKGGNEGGTGVSY